VPSIYAIEVTIGFSENGIPALRAALADIDRRSSGMFFPDLFDQFARALYPDVHSLVRILK
jgi:hypothetical protein